MPVHADDLELIEQLGAFETAEGSERIVKIALIAAADQVPASDLPTEPIRRWRRSLDDLSEATRLATTGGWLANRALGRCRRRLRAAEEDLDRHLDRTIRTYGLGEDLSAR
jgi:hypothetical protein